MLSPTGKLRQAVQSASETIRDAAGNTAKLVLAALGIASAALLLAAAALFLVLRIRKAVTA
jgi:hypothetical protein